MTDNRRRTGARYEQSAARYLEDLGYVILEKNFRYRGGEIDLIAMEKDVLIFCEVKYRSGSSASAALEAVDIRKQRQIIRTAQYYLMKHPQMLQMVMRFDVIGITGTGGIAHIENAFEATG